MSNWKNHVTALQKRHSELDKKIDALEQTGLYSDTLLHEMKKERLHLRDEIATLEQQHKDKKSL